MATTTITDLVRALNTTKTMVLPVDQEDSSTGEIETLKINLEQILNLFAVIGNEPPTGVAHAWTTDAIPTGYLELNGQTFDPNTYPQLGLIFPSGILPDWRGRVAKHAPIEQSAGTLEEDELKSHSHVISINNTDLGTKNSNSDTHQHNSGTLQTGNTSPYDSSFFPMSSTGVNLRKVSGATGITGGSTDLGLGRNTGTQSIYGSHFHTVTGATASDSHSHTIVMGSHNHTASCSNTGGVENKVKSVFARYIVRAR